MELLLFLFWSYSIWHNVDVVQCVHNTFLNFVPMWLSVYFVFFSMNSKVHLEYTWNLETPHMHSFYLGMCTILVNHNFVSAWDSFTTRIPHNITSKLSIQKCIEGRRTPLHWGEQMSPAKVSNNFISSSLACIILNNTSLYFGERE